MQFTKAHGTGNDFVVFADLDDQLDISAEFVRAVTDRRFGVGADGVIRIGRSQTADVFMDYRNADGSIVEMCGNGIRVVAKYVLDRELVTCEAALAVETRAGIKFVDATRSANGAVAEVTVDMGAPVFNPHEVPFIVPDANGPESATTAGREFAVELEAATWAVAVASMGNPHAVIRVDDVSAAPVGTVGPALEHHPAFPERVNVGFVEVVNAAQIRLRVWERGVGETAACGSGACAAVAVLQEQQLLGDQAEVYVPGGKLRIERRGSSMLLTGPAREVAHGTLDEAWLSTINADTLSGASVSDDTGTEVT